MSKKANQSKSDFVKLFLSTAEHNSNSKESAKEFLASEGVNTERLISEGLKRIKKMQLLADAKKTELEMKNANPVKLKATEWVDNLLKDINFSLPNLIQQEELSVSFRNVESLTKDDIRNILIKHFTLKFMNDNNKK